MSNAYFQFKKFLIKQEKSGMKVTTDGCLFGAWAAENLADSGLNRVLDIGTGTGLLTLMLAQKLDAKFDAVEVDKEVLEEAKTNFECSPWSHKISYHQTSIQEFESEESFDLIICNPPFFKENQTGKNQTKNLAIHDLSLSMEDLVAASNRLLSADGKLAVMYPEWEMKQFADQVQKKGLRPEKVLKVFNHKGSKTFRTLSIFSRVDRTANSNDFFIREQEGYSQEFEILLQKYYL